MHKKHLRSSSIVLWNVSNLEWVKAITAITHVAIWSNGREYTIFCNGEKQAKMLLSIVKAYDSTIEHGAINHGEYDVSDLLVKKEVNTL